MNSSAVTFFTRITESNFLYIISEKNNAYIEKYIVAFGFEYGMHLCYFYTCCVRTWRVIGVLYLLQSKK